jgi:crossover junction endodeoxyribonuclease RusA
MIRLFVPYPPSANHYWRRVGPRTLISRDGRQYRKDVKRAVHKQAEPIGSELRLAMLVRMHAPDRRRRDVDNIQKPLLDALEKSGLYGDDSQIDLLVTTRGEIDRPNGHVVIEAMAMPWHICPVCGRRQGAAEV